jgi:hypothetical protein
MPEASPGPIRIHRPGQRRLARHALAIVRLVRRGPVIAPSVLRQV